MTLSYGMPHMQKAHMSIPDGPHTQVTYVKGWGTFKGPNEIEVSLLDGGNQTVSGKNIIIATGSEVSPLPNIPIDEER